MQVRKIYLLLFFAFLMQGLAAQQTNIPLITEDFKDLKIEQFVKRLETKTGFKFYYIPGQLDSLLINLSVKNESLQQVMRLAFANTSIHFSTDAYNNVFIIKDKTIRTDLPGGFFGKTAANTANTNSTDADLNNTNKVTPTATLENKLYEIGSRADEGKPGNATLAGYIHDDKTGEPLPGVGIYLEKKQGVGAVTDQFGFFSISLPKGAHTLLIQSIGKRDTRRHILLRGDGKLNIDLHEEILSLREVVIASTKSGNVRNVQMGVERITIAAIKQVPTVFGEADILKVILTLPGVKSSGEASTGFNVRGGATDQNLILFNGATIYNPSHFFGFFSAFNPDVIKDVQLYKSSIPAKYGSRLSSVLDVTTREGNKKNIAGSAGIGPVTSRFNIEGPLFKDSSSSFVLGGRATYANWLLKVLPDQYKNSKAGFYDVSLHTTHDVNKKNSIYFTGYISSDRFNLNNDTVYGYNNRNISMQWKHIFNNRLNSLVTGGYDFYDYKISGDEAKPTAYALNFNIGQMNLKSDFSYYINPKHTIEFGAGSIYYKLNPGSFKPSGTASLVTPQTVPAEQALESFAYLGDRFNVTPYFSVNYAIRYSLYQFLGPQNVNIYANGLPRQESNIIDVKQYGKGTSIKTYGGPEYRLGLRYAFDNNMSIKAGYNSLRQYIHMLSNTSAIAPTDIWKLSDPDIKPQQGNQVSVGLYKNFKSNTIETSVEVYYKTMKHYLDYKSGAVLLLNKHIETDVINTRGKAYGIELLLKKTAGKLNGWISYTYSRTLLQIDDPIAGEQVNGGFYYPANFDKPHDLSVVGNLKLSHRFSLSTNIVYSTGRPITLPVARYFYAGGQRVVYSERNAFRIPDNFRADFSMNIDGNHKVHQKTHNSWTIGVYNATGRKNPYSVYFITENGAIKGYKLSIFGSAIPFINFNIKF
jgi:hypothetical protein